MFSFKLLDFHFKISVMVRAGCLAFSAHLPHFLAGTLKKICCCAFLRDFFILLGTAELALIFGDLLPRRS